MSDQFIGVDVGGTKIAAGVVTAEGEVLIADHSPTHGHGPATAWPTRASSACGCAASCARAGMT